MINDLKQLNFPRLAKDYFDTYAQLKQEKLDELQQIADYKAKQGWQSMYDEMLRQTGEAGSDGVEEAVSQMRSKKAAKVTSLDPKVEQEILVKARTSAVSEFALDNSISSKLSWLPHQLMAYFGTWKVVKDDNGVYLPEATYHANTRDIKDYFGLGSAILAKGDRTLFFKNAPKGNQQYKSCINPLVPIILAGFKRYQNIDYMGWKQSELLHLLDKDTLTLVGVSYPANISDADVLRIRTASVTDNTGPRAGIMNNTASCIKLNGIGETPLADLPKLAKYIILQTWCAHPENRDKYAILNLDNWDEPARDLVTAEVLVKPTSTAYSDLPW